MKDEIYVHYILHSALDTIKIILKLFFMINSLRSKVIIITKTPANRKLLPTLHLFVRKKYVNMYVKCMEYLYMLLAFVTVRTQKQIK